MFLYFFIGIILFVIFWLLKSYIDENYDQLIKKRTISENFKEMDILEFAKKEEKKSKKDPWRIYNIRKKKDRYELYDENKLFMILRIDEEEDKKRFRVFKDIHPVGTDVKQEMAYGSELTGRHNNMSCDIFIKNGKEKITIKLKNKQIKIAGILGENNNAEFPWHMIYPLVFTEKSRPIAYIEDTDKTEKGLPVNLHVSFDNIANVPLFFMVYIINHNVGLMKYIN